MSTGSRTLSGLGFDGPTTGSVALGMGNSKSVAGVIPWRLDFARIEEEDVFNLAAAQPPTDRRLSIAGCHVLPAVE